MCVVNLLFNLNCCYFIGIGCEQSLLKPFNIVGIQLLYSNIITYKSFIATDFRAVAAQLILVAVFS